MITQERLKELLHYDPETGIFTWIKPTARRITKGDRAGCVRPNGYESINIDNKRYYSHRLAFLYIQGYFPNLVDHIDNIKLNNRWSNLRVADKYQNGANSVISKSNTSGLKNVYWLSKRKKWIVAIRIKGKKTHFGQWDTLEEAELVSTLVREKYHGEFSNHGG